MAVDLIAMDGLQTQSALLVVDRDGPRVVLWMALETAASNDQVAGSDLGPAADRGFLQESSDFRMAVTEPTVEDGQVGGTAEEPVLGHLPVKEARIGEQVTDHPHVHAQVGGLVEQAVGRVPAGGRDQDIPDQDRLLVAPHQPTEDGVMALPDGPRVTTEVQREVVLI